MVWGKVMKADEKTCLRCKATIKKVAHLCKNCGHRFSEAEIEAGHKETQGDTKTFAVSIIVVVGVLALAVNSCLPSSTPSTTSPMTLAEIEAKVTEHAILLMDRRSFSKTYDKLGKAQFANANGLMRWAAVSVAASDRCAKVEDIGVSDQATRMDIKWYVDCSNDQRFMVSQEQAEAAKGRYDPTATPEARTAALKVALPESTNKAAQPVVDIEASKSPYADVGKQGLWIVTSQDAIRARLKDPDSAEFRNVRFYSGGSTPVACGEVNAKNGFGGKSGYERFIAAGSNLAILASDMKSSSEMNEVWAKMCVKSSTDEA